MFKKLLLAATALLALSAPSWATTCLNGSNGTNGSGGSAPGVPCITSVTPFYSGDPTAVQVCAQTSGSADFLVEFYYTVNSYDAPDANRFYYDPTMATSHCGVVRGLLPGAKTYAVGVASCGGASLGAGTPPFTCKRTDPNYSTSPWGNGNSNGLTFTTPTPSGPTFSWNSWFAQGPENIYQGSSGQAAISNQWVSGCSSGATGCSSSPNPAYIFLSNATLDGQPCTHGLPVEPCGTTGASIQFAQSNSENQSASTGNYDTPIASSGPFAGYPFCSNSTQVMNCFGEGVNFIRVAVGSSMAPGAHSLVATLQPTNSSQGTGGFNPQTITFNFTVLATPTFSVTTPGSFPSITGFSNYWKYLASAGVVDALQLINEEQALPGQYVNDNMSSSLTVGPYGLWNYDGARVAFGVADELSCTGTNCGNVAFQASHGYSLGDEICSNGAGGCAGATTCELVTTTAGTSSSSVSCPAVGNTVTSGTAHFTNIGNGAFWLGVAERIYDQYSDWQLFHDHYTTDEEWNRFTDGDSMHCFRTEVSCGAASPETRAVEFHLYPFFSPSGGWANTPQRIIWNYVQTERDTMRDREYEIPALYNYWVMSGTYPADRGVDELTPRIDSEIGQIEEVINYNPLDGHPYNPACCIGSPSFDMGLVAESLIHFWEVQNYEHVTPDARIPVEVKKLADWAYSNEWNLTGSDYNFPYTLWLYPYGSQMYNYEQSNLDMLMGPVYTWLWTVYGSSCTLPTSGASCLTVGDLMFQKAFANTCGSSCSKEFVQIYKWTADYIGWRSNRFPGTDSSILPSQNPFKAAATPIEPYPQSQYASNVNVANVTGTTAQITWYNTQAVTNTKVALCTSHLDGTCGSPILTTCGANSHVSGSDNLFLNQCTATGLNPSTGYYLAVGGTNANGTAMSSYDILYGGGSGQCYDSSGCSNSFCNSDPHEYAVCTGTSGALSITTASLPAGQNGVAYSQTISASGGTPPYTWCVVESPSLCDLGGPGSALPPGLRLTVSCCSTATLAGTPTTNGTYAFTIRVVDNVGAMATHPYSITISNPAIGITSPLFIPAGQVGVTYGPVTFRATGGTGTGYMYTCTASCITGLTLNSSTGVLTGRPTAPGTYSPVIHVVDSGSNSADHTYNNVVIAPPINHFRFTQSGGGRVSGGAVIH